jgi:hypothetical protein
MITWSIWSLVHFAAYLLAMGGAVTGHDGLVLVGIFAAWFSGFHLGRASMRAQQERPLFPPRDRAALCANPRHGPHCCGRND